MEPVRLKYLPETSVSEQLDLKVIFTDLRKTAAALAAARAMAVDLGARITLMVAQVVPYPLPITAPAVPVEFTRNLLESIAHNADDADAAVEIYLCRDRLEAIRAALLPGSIVIMGPRKWRDWFLTRRLRREGFRVLVVTQ